MPTDDTLRVKAPGDETVRRRGLAYIHRDALVTLLGLPADYEVLAVRVDWLREAVAVLVTGPGAPVVDELGEPPIIAGSWDMVTRTDDDGTVWARLAFDPDRD